MVKQAKGKGGGARRNRQDRADRHAAATPVSSAKSREGANRLGGGRFYTEAPAHQGRPPSAAAPGNLVVQSGASPKAQTVIYVHGIGNKPVCLHV
jgi:hypothetical protein